ncbi:lysophospholipid acyltransferase family protein [Rhizorhapis suberifaciens]|nr:lysophospholipid acyltransferase family protein [Rhizorhapis suberifaciens]
MRIGLLIASLFACLPPHLLYRLFRRPSPWPSRFLALAARSAGARVHIEGKPMGHDAFYVSNHVSWIDILALGGHSGCAFVAHDGIARWPLIGWLAAQNNTIFVSRETRRDVHKQVDELRGALARHQPIAVFPEGTTGDGVSLLPFKPSLLAVMAPPPRDMLVQPVFIDYGDAAPDIAWINGEPAGKNAARVLAREGQLPVTLRFLEPFDPAHFSDRKAIAIEARKRIAACLSAFAGTGGHV